MWRACTRGEHGGVSIRSTQVAPDGGAEPIGDVHQPLEETVEAVTLVPRERVRQLAAEQFGDAPQFLEETVDEELPVPRERVQKLTAEQIGNVPRDDVKYSATATGTTVAKPVGDGEVRLPGITKNSTTTAFPVVVPTVAKSVGDVEARPPEFAKDSAKTASKVAVSSGGAGPSWRRAKSTPSARVTADARPAGEARPPGITEQSAMIKPELAESSDEVVSSWFRANGKSAEAAADAVPAGEARPLGIPKQSATTKLELAESSGEAGSPWSRAGSTTNTVAAAAIAYAADEARPPGFAKHSATTESVPELVESFGEDFFSDQEKQLLHSLRNMGRERAMRSLEKLREKRDLPSWLDEGLAELFQRFPFE